MTSPSVCAVMLTKDRPEMARRAVECFQMQTYTEKRLLIYNCNTPIEYGHVPGVVELPAIPGDLIEVLHGQTSETIGQLRNNANAHADYPILIHWDDDDWSHPRRIEEQVALLQSSGADTVGYRQLLFWRGPSGPHDVGPMERTMPAVPGEAWLYTNHDRKYACGTSLCYWRRTWEAHPFPALPTAKGGSGEDTVWLRELNCVGISANPIDGHPPMHFNEQPRMIARIHPGNTQYYGADLLRDSSSWKRFPEFDAVCRQRMK
jgi:Glycosyl transferase family 2